MISQELRSDLAERWRLRRGHLARRVTRAHKAEPAPRQGAAASPHRRLRQELLEQLLRDVGESGAPARQEPLVRERVRRVMAKAFERGDMPALARAEREALEQELVAEAVGLGPLSPFVTDATVSDVLVNGPDEVYIDRFGRLEKTAARFDSIAHLLHLITRLVAAHGRHIDAASPYVDVQMDDGSRLHAVVPPLTPRPVLCIRRSRSMPFTLDQLCAAGTLSAEMAEFLRDAVAHGSNVVISGGVGSGKTTLLNVLAGFIPANERVVTIEETAELRLPHPHVVTLEARPPNREGRGEVTVRALVRNALRMRADRLIVGEVRGPEVFDMLQAMNTGHAGSLTTVHANSTGDALRRLENLVLLAGFPLPSAAIRELLSMTVHLIVQLRRFPNGTRRIVAIDAVHSDPLSLTPVFTFDGDTHRRVATHDVRPSGEAIV